jgi:hypothetical protein
MPKLNLKRTRAEEEEHRLRKERKAARKARSRANRPSLSFGDAGGDNAGPSRSGSPYHKRQRNQHPTIDPLHDPTFFSSFSSDEDDGELYGPQPSTSHKPDYDAIRARLEEERFREKMYGAFEDDAGIYGVEERLNQFVHVPERWRGPAERVNGAVGAGVDIDPQYMDDEEYAEWVRMSMWK